MKKIIFLAVLGIAISSFGLLNAQDLELDVHVLPTSIIGDPAAFNIGLRNMGEEDAHGIEVQIKLEPGLSYRSFTPNTLNFNPETGIWRLDTLGDKRSKVLTILATYAQRDNAILSAEVIASSGLDPDSTPNNGIDTNGNGKIINDKGDEDDGDAAQNGPFN
ncbi:DUF11 domain-containing protein [Allomuricauda sp. SCSIO 65647]|uniref:DUF11 domain-containing protein n=1 Tax=Allomuricauda sp. SCSIO 65647 TaxID=2908843 RepID=UPI001F40ED29|nr:DUF11 domain-containing protein [Muricauda sp. SCSIO 65647]UJH66472.1 DUF11 domain-containing protein [Muricauda sp. SCSIO 65647]